MKKYLLIFLLIFFVNQSVYSARPFFDLDVGKNAARHNNLGLAQLYDGNYDMAIAEFQLAIDLNPNSKACAIYYNNLGDAYMNLGYYQQAQISYENAIKISPLTFVYYKNAAKCYKMQGNLNLKIKQYKELENTNSLYMVMLGLCYIEKGDIRKGIIKLDEFCMKEPYLITTPGVKKYLKELTEEYY
jgi:tetratricopeptide (TPR) repeat protein